VLAEDIAGLAPILFFGTLDGVVRLRWERDPRG
jgi:hypothetical protein